MKRLSVAWLSGLALAVVFLICGPAQAQPAAARPVYPIFASLERKPDTQATPPDAHYVGSKACASCHADEFARWSKTRMANVVTDPKLHPDVVVGDFKTPNPLVTFAIKDVDFVYGTVWKQRYFHKVGRTYAPYPVQWDITNRKWLPYHVADTADWWAVHYPDPKGDNSGRPTGPTCDGCHSVAYDIKTQTPAEWNVGCEMCHGAGSAHAAQPTRENILNPAKMDYVRANDTCIQCHSQGQPLGARPNADGKYYDWPVGFHEGLDLKDFWQLEPHRLGDLTFTHFPDGTGHKNRMQGNDFVQSLMYARGVTCFSCHDPHGTPNKAMLRAPVETICLTCHMANGRNGPHAATIEAHTHHAAGSPGSSCVACHMPLIQQTVANIKVASHTFHFVTPTQTDALQIPNACNACHKDKTTAWATDALKHWDDRSPWRMTQ
ncbi:MAG TPA: multiheme c-type cytochrome [Phenylobacterium sp.]|uniref:cytochrome c3 family protein n=1 Tax=Phenylobacterium sp. TaxID=1871053 RepID=UPI002D729326|nr:multiheme c-type cytochrome [Phenylobacterium sp.]HZZ67317.1 multiheme c-type cytochrome [Phenylobacterium sp.]